MLTCAVCGGTAFVPRRVLQDGLVAEWQLSPQERDYVDRQQGTCCTGCGANLRSVALAGALLRLCSPAPHLRAFVADPANAALRVLEVNEAGTLTPELRRLPGHVLAQYPAVDMHALPYPDASFHVVVHSDTLEHVAQPERALAECRRVLIPGGALCFTIPVIVGRMSRSREGLPVSRHGGPVIGSEVRTEFGADMWTYVLRAGFSTLTLNAVDYPAGLAITAWR